MGRAAHRYHINNTDDVSNNGGVSWMKFPFGQTKWKKHFDNSDKGLPISLKQWYKEKQFKEHHLSEIFSISLLNSAGVLIKF